MKYRFVLTRDGVPVQAEERRGAYTRREDARLVAQQMVDWLGGAVEIWQDKPSARFPLEIVGGGA